MSEPEAPQESAGIASETEALGSDDRPDDPPSVRSLFVAFFQLGMTGFGGVLPLARRMLVEQREWLSGTEFAEVLALCQFLPGGNIVNVSVVLGRRFRGLRGSLAAISGLLIGPSILVIALWAAYERFAADRLVHGAVLGLAAGACGLLANTAVKLLLPLRGRPIGALVAGLVTVAMWIVGAPLFAVLLIATPLSIAVAGGEKT